MGRPMDILAKLEEFRYRSAYFLWVGVFFIGGLSMIFMGVLGEYLGKIFLEVKKRPKYVVKEESGFGREE